MGLFKKDKKDKKDKAAPEKEPETKRVIVTANLSKSAARTDIADGDEGTYFKGCHLWAEDGKIRAFQGSTLIFEVTNKSKAYAELEPLVGKQLERIVMRKKQSDYGLYYNASIAVELSEDEITYK